MRVSRRLHTMRPCLAGVPHQLLDVELPCSRVSLRARVSRHQRKRLPMDCSADARARRPALDSGSVAVRSSELPGMAAPRPCSTTGIPLIRLERAAKTPMSRTRAAPPSTPLARRTAPGMPGKPRLRRGGGASARPGDHDPSASTPGRSTEDRPTVRTRGSAENTGSTAPVGPVSVSLRNSATGMARPPRSSDRATDRTPGSAPRTPEAPRARPPPPFAQ